MDCYKRIRKYSPKWACFLFMDHKEYLADSLFIQEKCEVRFLKEYQKKGTDWVMLYVKVRKADIPKFEAALSKLRNKAILAGHTDYDEAFRSYWMPFMDGTGGDNEI